MSIVDMAWQVIEMQRTIQAQELELARLYNIEAAYNKLLADSINHSRAMMGNMLNVLLTPGVAETFTSTTEIK